jgi:hypothetical protein
MFAVFIVLMAVRLWVEAGKVNAPEARAQVVNSRIPTPDS